MTAKRTPLPLSEGRAVLRIRPTAGYGPRGTDMGGIDVPLGDTPPQITHGRRTYGSIERDGLPPLLYHEARTNAKLVVPLLVTRATPFPQSVEPDIGRLLDILIGRGLSGAETFRLTLPILSINSSLLWVLTADPEVGREERLDNGQRWYYEVTLTFEMWNVVGAGTITRESQAEWRKERQQQDLLARLGALPYKVKATTALNTPLKIANHYKVGLEGAQRIVKVNKLKGIRQALVVGKDYLTGVDPPRTGRGAT